MPELIQVESGLKQFIDAYSGILDEIVRETGKIAETGQTVSNSIPDSFIHVRFAGQELDEWPDAIDAFVALMGQKGISFDANFFRQIKDPRYALTYFNAPKDIPEEKSSYHSFLFGPGPILYHTQEEGLVILDQMETYSQELNNIQRLALGMLYDSTCINPGSVVFLEPSSRRILLKSLGILLPDSSQLIYKPLNDIRESRVLFFQNLLAPEHPAYFYIWDREYGNTGVPLEFDRRGQFRRNQSRFGVLGPLIQKTLSLDRGTYIPQGISELKGEIEVFTNPDSPHIRTIAIRMDDIGKGALDSLLNHMEATRYKADEF